MIVIDVAKQFSKTPFGRHKPDGPNSAERFRDEILIQELEKSEDITIDFTKVALGVGSSFLEETFGGLIRKDFDYCDLVRRITIKDKIGIYDKQVKRFMRIAWDKKKKG